MLAQALAAAAPLSASSPRDACMCPVQRGIERGMLSKAFQLPSRNVPRARVGPERQGWAFTATVASLMEQCKARVGKLLAGV